MVSWYPNDYEYPNYTTYPRNKAPLVSTMAIRGGFDPKTKVVDGKLTIVHQKRIGFATPDRLPYPSKSLFPSKTLYPFKDV